LKLAGSVKKFLRLFRRKGKKDVAFKLQNKGDY